MAMGIPRITEQQALQDGYPKSVFGANEQTEANDVDLSKALYGPADSPKVSAVLGDTEKSISGSGCFADGFKKVYGTIADGMLATGLATDSIHGATLSAAYDDDLGAANAEWAGCIKGTPFPELEGPGAAYAFAQDNPDQALAVAEVDSECREKVNFNQKLDLVIEKYLTTYLHNMEPYINQIQSIRAKAEVRGRSILGG
ncbi:hypothetical protein AL755_18125 [Arthrobacter sp. ERGS1:01]|nr:hypothetical protein AL755_18125 [Arthrobacter sp. ERGS1:01]